MNPKAKGILLLLTVISGGGGQVALQDADPDNGGWRLPGEEPIGVEGPCNIDRIKAADLTQSKFLSEYAYSKPLIIEGIIEDNKAFRRRTEKSVMLGEWSDTKIMLNSANTYSYTRVESTFGEYVQKMLKPQERGAKGSDTLYLFGDIDQEVWAPLLSEYKRPPWRVPGHEPALSFGIAAVGTGVPFHFHGPGFAEVLHGSKRWFLTPYESPPAFDPNESTLNWYLNHQRVPSDVKNSPVLECLLRPGELIYFPDKWYHATLNAETSVFISTFLSPTASSNNNNNEL